MRTRTHLFLSRLPARKSAALAVLFVLVCGGLLVGGNVWS